MPRPDPFIIGFAGRAHSGKDTAALHLVQRYGFHRFAFADPLREMLFALLDQVGADHAYATEPHLKEVPIPGLGFSYRHLAQTLGTDWAREQLDGNFWLNTAALALGITTASAHRMAAPVHDRIVIPDVRFRNELQWINAQGGVVIHLSRPTAPGVRHHLSELQLDGVPMWAHLDNTGTVQQLHTQLDALLDRLQLGPRPVLATTQEG